MTQFREFAASNINLDESIAWWAEVQGAVVSSSDYHLHLSVIQTLHMYKNIARGKFLQAQKNTQQKWI